MKVKDWMRKELVTITPDDDLLKADRLMTVYQIRHLPVLDKDGKLCGLLTDRALRDNSIPTGISASLPANQQHLKTLKVASIMVGKVITIQADESMEKVVRIMKSRKITCLPVMEGEKLVGIITTTYLLTFFGHYMGAETGHVRMEVAIENNPARLTRLLELFNSRGLSIGSFHYNRKGKSANGILAFTFPNGQRQAAQEALAELGLEPVSVYP